MADGAASSRDGGDLKAEIPRRRGGASGERPAVVLLPLGPAAPRWAAPVTIGMPHLSLGGMSETWLLKECGHRHWLMLADAIGRAATDFEDAEGTRVYAAFTGLAIEDASLDAPREGDLAFFRGEIRRISRSQFMSEQTLVVDGRGLATIRMISVFLRRTSGGLNRSVERAVMKHLPPFHATPETQGFPAIAYGFRAAHWESFGGFRRQDRRVLRSFAVDPCPQTDFNGADLLYFSSFQSFVDRAEWAWFRYADPVATTRHRHIFYYGNIDLGDTLDIRLCAVTRGAHHCAHWCEITRQSDGARIADVITERILAG